MGWLILVAYVAVGVWSTRIMLRWASKVYPDQPLENEDLVLLSAAGLGWPIMVPVMYTLLCPPGSNRQNKTDARLRKFAGLPPRKEH